MLKGLACALPAATCRFVARHFALSGTDLSQPTDRDRGAVRRRRHDRHRGSADRPTASPTAGANRSSSTTGRGAAAISAPGWSPKPRPTAIRCWSPPSPSRSPPGLQKQPYDAIKDFTADHRNRVDPDDAGGAQRRCRSTPSRSSSNIPRRSPAASITPRSGPGTSTHLAGEMFKTDDRSQACPRAVQR